MGENPMIRCEQTEPRYAESGNAFVVHYRTPKREGFRRFGGFKAREKATLFAVEILRELLDN